MKPLLSSKSFAAEQRQMKVLSQPLCQGLWAAEGEPGSAGDIQEGPAGAAATAGLCVSGAVWGPRMLWGWWGCSLPGTEGHWVKKSVVATLPSLHPPVCPETPPGTWVHRFPM